MSNREKDFNELFDQWAPIYDQTVSDENNEYNEVFEGYRHILNKIVELLPQASKQVLEFGVGTGNLSEMILMKGYQLIGIEPSLQMREIVKRKAIPIDLREGDFLNIPLEEHEKVDAIVSSYAFHHLTLAEKKISIQRMKKVLSPQGEIIFADTSYENVEAKQAIIDRVTWQEKLNLLEDLRTEYYEFNDDLRQIFEEEGFKVKMTSLNRFVWLLHAKS